MDSDGATVGSLVLGPPRGTHRLDRHHRRVLAEVLPFVVLVLRARAEAQALKAARTAAAGAREDERRRLRRDLHDGVGPLLATQLLILDTHRVTGKPELLVHLEEQARAAVGEVRRVAHDLRPAVLDAGGLPAALAAEAERVQAAGLPVELVVDLGDAEPTAAAEVALLRIAQEALTNVVKHAEATRARVRLTADEHAWSWSSRTTAAAERAPPTASAPRRCASAPSRSAATSTSEPRRTATAPSYACGCRDERDRGTCTGGACGAGGGGGHSERTSDAARADRGAARRGPPDVPVRAADAAGSRARHRRRRGGGVGGGGRGAGGAHGPRRRRGGPQPARCGRRRADPAPRGGRPARRDARAHHAQRRLGDRGRARGRPRLPAERRRAGPDRRGRARGGRGGVGVLRCGGGAAARGAGRAAAGAHGVPELTAREHEILELLAVGLTNAEIGRRLALRPKTVRNYVANVLAKIHAADRADAVLRARRAGLG